MTEYHPLPIPGERDPITETQLVRATLIANAEERSLRIFDGFRDQEALVPGTVDLAALDQAEAKLHEFADWGRRAVLMPTRHSLPDDPE